ncbi:MAG TPA: YwiC-like family protein [Blastocatellia bacterium]|nr:YwiC-like family protein [Blastocatellia bacterium]
MSLSSKLKLPREHGAWAMLYVPFALGVAVAGQLDWAALSLLLSASFLFISRESLLVWWRARTRGRDAGGAGRLLVVYLALSLAAGLPLILVWHLFRLIPIGLAGGALLLINGRQATRLEERSIGGELLAIAGLTLTAPAGYYAARGVWDATALWLWLLSAFYFASSVFYIKLRIYGLNPRKQEDWQRLRWSCAGYHLFLCAALLALIVFGDLSLLALMAFGPVLARTFRQLLKPVNTISLTRAGLLEIAYSLTFLIFTKLGFYSA